MSGRIRKGRAHVSDFWVGIYESGWPTDQKMGSVDESDPSPYNNMSEVN